MHHKVMPSNAAMVHTHTHTHTQTKKKKNRTFPGIFHGDALLGICLENCFQCTALYSGQLSFSFKKKRKKKKRTKSNLEMSHFSLMWGAFVSCTTQCFTTLVLGGLTTVALAGGSGSGRWSMVLNPQVWCYPGRDEFVCPRCLPPISVPGCTNEVTNAETMVVRSLTRSAILQPGICVRSSPYDDHTHHVSTG